MRAGFRVDASPTIGLGHLMRCLHLADALRVRGVECTFYSARPSGEVAALVDARGYRQVRIAAEAGSREDRVACTAAASGADCIVVDGYVFDVEYTRCLRGVAYTCVVDDVGDRAIDADAVLNPNFYAADLPYADLPDGCLRLLGPSYAIVGDAFVYARERRPEPRDPADRLLVLMGGADPTRHTERVLRALRAVGKRLDVRVVVGPANPHGAQIEAEAAQIPHRTVVLRAPAVADEMLACDVALTAAGTTALELACVTVPAIALAVVQNQVRVAQTVQRDGLMWAFCDPRTFDEAALATAVERLFRDYGARSRMCHAQRAVIDGRGKERAAEALITAVKGARA